MTEKEALEFLLKWSEETTWQVMSDKLGLSLQVVYGWYRRGRVPKWRIPAIEVIAKKQRGAR